MYMPLVIKVLFSLLLLSAARGIPAPWGSSRWQIPLPIFRGGGADDPNDDSERYSRQVFTLGARAHNILRSSTTMYLDGPSTSGLLYETAKNLALTGVRNIVIVTTSNDDNENSIIDGAYHNERLDDLGQTYKRGARAEMKDTSLSDHDLLVAYLRRLNPGVAVSKRNRSDLPEHSESEHIVYVCLDRPYATLTVLNKVTRERNWKFVSVETAGVYGRVICDFGNHHQVYDPDGETPLVVPLDRIERSSENGIIVHCIQGEKHDVSKGDPIQFQFRNGDLYPTTPIVTDVQTPFRFCAELKDRSEPLESMVDRINADAASFSRVKVPTTQTFQSLESAVDASKTDSSLFTPSDLDKSFDLDRRNAVMALFQALSSFVETNGRLPMLEDKRHFWKLAVSIWGDSCLGGKKHCRSFLRGCTAKLVPLQAVLGAVGAQEALKAATGLYSPIKQILLYDCDEILVNADKKLPEECASSGLRTILGDATVDELERQKVFLVGAGAIGCEILKNLAALGVGTKGKGAVVLTDMDTIEKSNLSRQLLFRDTDIGKFKSVAAREAASRLNEAMKVEAFSNKVGSDSQSPFNDAFWAKKVDLVLNALDNVEARLYIDDQCVSNKKALVDAGTLGPKGNVQVVVPNESESYSSSIDPPDPSIPVCTLKNFPYAISHTIQWARDLFDGLFEKRPIQTNSFLGSLSCGSTDDFATKMIAQKGEEAALEAALELSIDLAANELANGSVKTLRKMALDWTVQLAHQLYIKSSADLLREHPLHSIDEDGEPFWSGTRRRPRLLSFGGNAGASDQADIDQNLIDFVQNGARLRAESLLGASCSLSETHFDKDEVLEALASQFVSDIKKLSDSDKDTASSTKERVHVLLKDKGGTSNRMTAIEFEKDDDTNGHIAFIAAASNLRAIVYGIPSVDAMETRRVAGKIVPAMITTTAFVSGLSSLELIKLVQKSKLNVFRNAFINLALPFFAFTVPLPAERIQGPNGRSFTIWDQLAVKESKKAASSGGIKLKSLLKQIRKMIADEQDNVDVASISVGPFMLYANFLHADDKTVLNAPIWDLVNDALASDDDFEDENSRDDEVAPSSRDVTLHEDFVELSVVVEDETGAPCELPPLRVLRFKE